MNYRRKSFWMCGAALALSAPVAVHAQDAAPDEGTSMAADDVPGDEIVVTAQKREQNLQKVPVSVSVLSSSVLADNRVSGLEQLAQVSPSIGFTNSANTRGQGLSIRGIGTLNFSDGVEPSVSTVIDGVVIGRSAASFFEFNDIERIEVLRGPQGTLFGKNSSAGALNVVTGKPDLNESSLEATASYGTFDDVRLKATGSLVLDQGRAALRISGFRSKADGIITNTVDGRKLNDNDSWGVRAKLLFEPSDVTSIYVIGDYGESNRNCCASTVRSVLPTTTYYNGQTRAALLAGQTLGPLNREVTIDGDYFNRQKTGGASVEINTELGGQTITSITAYREFKVFDNNDPDGVPLPVVSLNNARQKQQQFTQELRLTSPAGEPVEYVFGLFYFWQDVVSQTQVKGNLTVNLPAGQYLGNQVDRDITTKNVAAFGQVTGHLTDELSLIGGFRLTSEQAVAHFDRTILPGAIAAMPSLGGPAYVAPTLKATDTDLSYKLGVQYQATPDIMAYATYTRGYKGPALNLLNNLTAPTVNAGLAVLRPEIARNWEAGVRTTLFDRMLTLNVTGFYETFTDFQAQTYSAILTSFQLTNAGKLITQGAEVEAILRPLDGLSLSGNLAYTDTEVRGLIVSCYPGQTAAQGCASGRQDVTGEALTNAPKWAWSLNANYGADIGNSLRGSANLSFTYRSKTLFSYRDPNTEQRGYGLLNGRLSLAAQDGRYELSVFGKNLTNQHFASFIGTGLLDTSATGAGYTQLLTPDAFRTFGVEGTVRF
ncbi:MAG TPA: TonB-dependent receptor [Sphingopyxis sp.]|uniref:TonB-dependent receptor n=1 Tax=Sphingopyxis sp. TaxID=1908224 RepID=UPI002CCB7139|nr:TonB-dependent receptor [Sphingopyxis sp.]HWW59407.1 TonB-dependent receptor [Sphingopyxis sp.]